jgi:hypothetical protein
MLLASLQSAGLEHLRLLNQLACCVLLLNRTLLLLCCCCRMLCMWMLAASVCGRMQTVVVQVGADSAAQQSYSLCVANHSMLRQPT